jgi:hypothetical protein
MKAGTLLNTAVVAGIYICAYANGANGDELSLRDVPLDTTDVTPVCTSGLGSSYILPGPPNGHNMVVFKDLQGNLVVASNLINHDKKTDTDVAYWLCAGVHGMKSATGAGVITYETSDEEDSDYFCQAPNKQTATITHTPEGMRVHLSDGTNEIASSGQSFRDIRNGLLEFCLGNPNTFRIRPAKMGD